MQKLLRTVEEAAEMLSVSRCTIYQLINEEQLYSVKLGRARRVPATAIQQFVDELGGAAE